MVNNEEISDNEAMFRYLNLIDVEIFKNKISYTDITQSILMIIIQDRCYQYI